MRAFAPPPISHNCAHGGELASQEVSFDSDGMRCSEAAFFRDVSAIKLLSYSTQWRYSLLNGLLCVLFVLKVAGSLSEVTPAALRG